MRLNQPQQQFMTWLKHYDAPLHTVLLEQAKLGNTLGAASADEPGFFDKLTSGFSNAIDSVSATLAKALPVYTAVKTNNAVIKNQIARANAGLPPVELSTPAANPTPVPQAQLPVVKQIAAKSASSFNWGGMQSLLPLAIGGALLWAITSKKKGR